SPHVPHSFPTRRSSDLFEVGYALSVNGSNGFTQPLWSGVAVVFFLGTLYFLSVALKAIGVGIGYAVWAGIGAIAAAVLGPVLFRSEEHTSELQSRENLV